MVKNVSSQDLSDAIVRIHGGDTLFPVTLPSLTEIQDPDPSDTQGPQQLSRRQREVLSLIAEGLSSHAIGERLHLSQRTVETHRRHICHRLQIRTVAGLTKYAIAAGLTRLD
jgi:DNA-binding NarL/FixJ family response regulator